MVPVIIAAPRPMSATDGVGNGWKIRPRMVPTKMASMCMPRGSTPSGAGTNQRARVTATMMATCTISFVRLDFAAFTSSADAAVGAAALAGGGLCHGPISFAKRTGWRARGVVLTGRGVRFFCVAMLCLCARCGSVGRRTIAPLIFSVWGCHAEGVRRCI